MVYYLVFMIQTIFLHTLYTVLINRTYEYPKSNNYDNFTQLREQNLKYPLILLERVKMSFVSKQDNVVWGGVGE